MIAQFECHGFKDYRDYRFAVALSPDGSVLAVSDRLQAKVILLDVKSARGPLRVERQGPLQVARWPELESAAFKHLDGLPTVTALAFSPDDRLLAAATEESGTLLIEWKTGKEVGRLPTPNAHMWQLAFSPDRRRLAVVERHSSEVMLWDVPSAKLVARFIGPTLVMDADAVNANEARAIVFSPDGSWLVAAFRDRGVRAWPLPAGRPVRLLTVLGGEPDGIGFTREKQLLTLSKDRAGIVWDFDRLIKKTNSASAGGAGDWDKLWRDLFGEGPAKADAAVRAMSQRPREAVDYLKRKTQPSPAPEQMDIHQMVGLLRTEWTIKEVQELAESLGRHYDIVAGQVDNEVEPRRKVVHLPDGRQMTFRGPDLHASEVLKEAMRSAGAVDVLEAIGSPEARKLLEKLAGGYAKSGLTRKAHAALAHLEQSSGASDPPRK
jgi:hypothetical protein